MSQPRCRLCHASLSQTFCDLGMSPLSNAYIDPARAYSKEAVYPLRAWLCERCLLVQLEAFETPERIFGDYAYFSSYSDSWLEHSRAYAISMRERLQLGRDSLVVEVASNDGYLLQYFSAAAIPVLGIEPAANVAIEAVQKGVPTKVGFFGAKLANELVSQGKRADLLIGNNVLAHVPDLNDFVEGFALLVADDGVITMEFPHLLRLIQQNQFDTIYHEHFSYFSLLTAEKAFAAHDLTVYDVEQIPTHGGSLRVFVCRMNSGRNRATPRLIALRAEERAANLDQTAGYTGFAGQVAETRRALLALLEDLKRNNKRIVGYGAPAKGNTLLNYCGIGADVLDYTVDRSPHKQGRLLPGTRIPIHSPVKIAETRPDYLLILPWNIKDEIMEQMAQVRGWGGRFIVPIPEPTVIP